MTAKERALGRSGGGWERGRSHRVQPDCWEAWSTSILFKK